MSDAGLPPAAPPAEAEDVRLLEHDIILGRHKIALHHPGNMRFTQLINAHLDEYKQSVDNKAQKSQILGRILSEIEGGGKTTTGRSSGSGRGSSTGGARFLKLQGDKKWKVASRSVARERISQGLRDALKDYYKSSLTHKQKRRMVKSGSLAPDDPTLVIKPAVVAKATMITNHAGNAARQDDNNNSSSSSSNNNKECNIRLKRAKKEGTVMTGPGYDETTAPVPAEDSGMPEFSVAMASTTVDDTSYSKIEHDDNDDDNDDELTTRTTQTESDNTQPSLPIDGIKMMDEGFQPGAYDVVVGMRKKSTTHSGNLHLLRVVKDYLEEYKQCGSNKNKKSQVLNKVANVLLREQNPPTRFVKMEPKHKRWYIIEAHKMLISQKFRDLAQEGYRSASSFKNMRRRKGTGGMPLLTTVTTTDDMPPLSMATDPTNRDDHPEGMASVTDGQFDNNFEKSFPEQPNHVSATMANDSTIIEPALRRGLTKKEQLERQIEVLKKQLDTLDDELDEQKNTYDAKPKHESNSSGIVQTQWDV